ncbi:hypothetical protein [Seonamhaeicola sp. ML3]|uniref:hypothetical protein n=1 Tax=Seonamhaeicola sp. ML3 TaxID=2937786 RepID=UPI00200BE329|nr:hypothetical protein [Seonamhaeicola sp. ML3]
MTKYLQKASSSSNYVVVFSYYNMLLNNKSLLFIYEYPKPSLVFALKQHGHKVSILNT